MRKLKPFSNPDKNNDVSLKPYFENAFKDMVLKNLLNLSAIKKAGTEEKVRRDIIKFCKAQYQYIPAESELEMAVKTAKKFVDVSDLVRYNRFFEWCNWRLKKIQKQNTAPNIFLDDLRPAPENFIGIKNYDDFVNFINQNGMPNFISFDEDLGGEKTGYDAAKFLKKYCTERNISQINFQVHSRHLGKTESIEEFLEGF